MEEKGEENASLDIEVHKVFLAALQLLSPPTEDVFQPFYHHW